MLRRGSRGEDVEALQRKLLAKGINPGPVDGIFGPKTEDAIKRFQERFHLEVDLHRRPQDHGCLRGARHRCARGTDRQGFRIVRRDDRSGWRLVVCRPSDDGVSPGLDASGCVLRLDASRRCRASLPRWLGDTRPPRHTTSAPPILFVGASARGGAVVPERGGVQAPAKPPATRVSLASHAGSAGRRAARPPC